MKPVYNSTCLNVARFIDNLQRRVSMMLLRCDTCSCRKCRIPSPPWTSRGRREPGRSCTPARSSSAQTAPGPSSACKQKFSWFLWTGDQVVYKISSKNQVWWPGNILIIIIITQTQNEGYDVAVIEVWFQCTLCVVFIAQSACLVLPIGQVASTINTLPVFIQSNQLSDVQSPLLSSGVWWFRSFWRSCHILIVILGSHLPQGSERVFWPWES